MAGSTPTVSASIEPAASPAIRWLLTAVAVLFLGLFVVVPIVNVFSQALSKGLSSYEHVFFPGHDAPPAGLTRLQRRQYLREPEEAAKTWSSIRMTLGVAAVAVPINVIFGLAASWLIAKFKFKGRSLLIALIDLPFSVSPVVAGLIFVLLFGRTGWFGNWAMNFRWNCPSISWRGFDGHAWPFAFVTTAFTGIVFTPLAMVIATVFITFPFVARNLIPLMEAQGADEELAAATLGAGGWQTFRKVTLPNVKWGLLYGVILCNARAMGEFGAVSVVGGQMDSTNTIPLRVERLYQDANISAAFAVGSILALLAVVTLIFKTTLEWKQRRDLVAAGGD
jgi:sulfate transport system permease protein